MVGVFFPAAATAKSLQSCPTLCNPIDGSPPGSPVPGTLQARALECVAISFPNTWKWKVKVKSLSCVRLSATPWTAAYQAPPFMGFSSKSTGVGCHCLLCFSPEVSKIRHQHLMDDFPGDSVGKNLPDNVKDMVLVLGPGRVHMPQSDQDRVPQLLSLSSRARKPQLLSPHATTTEARMPKASAPQEKSP